MPTRHIAPPISPPPGQEDQSARLAASAEVGQVEGTTCPHCGKALTPSADVFDRIAGFPFEKCSCQVEGTIPQIYQDYMANMEVLWDMVMNAKDAREKHALMGGVAAIKTLLLDRGYGA